MNIEQPNTFCLVIASLFLGAFVAAGAWEQPPSPSPAPVAPPMNPFAQKPAPPLPAGMTGSDVNDPRFKLSPGMYDAGETAMGLKHLLLLKKTESFQISNDPNDTKTAKGARIRAAP